MWRGDDGGGAAVAPFFTRVFFHVWRRCLFKPRLVISIYVVLYQIDWGVSPTHDASEIIKTVHFYEGPPT